MIIFPINTGNSLFLPPPPSGKKRGEGGTDASNVPSLGAPPSVQKPEETAAANKEEVDKDQKAEDDAFFDFGDFQSGS